MRRPFFLIFINAMILIVVFALLTQSLVIVQRIARVDGLQGEVEVRRVNQTAWKTLSQGKLVKTGDVVRTGKDGKAEFKWADGTRWKMMPNTEITVAKSSYNMLEKADHSRLKIASGKIFIRLVKTSGAGSHFEVETPTSVASALGTIFSVEVKEGVTEVAVYKGKVWLASEGESASEGEVVASGKAAICAAPGELHREKDATLAAVFQKQSTIVQPQLSAEIKPLRGERIIISGTAEAGNRVDINGKNVRVLGNGSFLFRAPAQETKAFTITATDKHGARATRVLHAAAP